MGILSVLVGAALACPWSADPTAISPAPTSDSSYRRLFESGRSYADFMANAERRKEQWEKNFRAATVPDALLARARATAGPWKLLVVAVDGCSDSVNTIPYIARLVEQLMGVELRVIGSDEGRAIMEAHRTPDGRAATPTLLLLDGNYEERGSWIERPAELRLWMTGQKGKLKDDGIFEGKMKWYDDDKGLKTIEEVVGLMEKALVGR
ncbi:MAG: thioredoxin family protein [Gemmatimonadaceae bacterium]